jgi:hypothetical protein
MGSPSPGPTRRGGLLIPLLLAAACDLPTEIPWWETRWVLPGEDTRIDADAFLPSGVTVSDDRSVFLVHLEAPLESRTLAEVCPLCVPLDGQTAPKPAFEAEISVLAPIPAELEEALLDEGVLRLEVDNGFNFDPIRPGSDPGSLEVLVWDGSNGGRLLADTLISGAADSFPPGTRKVVDLALEPGLLLDGLFVELLLDSPLGDQVEIRSQDRLDGHFVPEPLRLTWARIQVAEKEVILDATELDLEDLDQGMVDRVLEGDVEIGVENPFDVTLDLTLRITGPDTPALVREITIVPGTSVQQLEFSGAELRSFLGRPGVVLEGAGTVRSDAPPVEVRPDQEVSLKVTLDLILRMGSEP